MVIGAIPRKDSVVSVYETLTLMIAFATLVLLITDHKNQKK